MVIGGDSVTLAQSSRQARDNRRLSRLFSRYKLSERARYVTCIPQREAWSDDVMNTWLEATR